MTTSTGAPMRYWSPWLGAFVLAWLGAYVALAPHPAELAAQNGYLVLVGLAAAFIGNITAVGGGLVFIPVAILVLHLPPVQALKLAILSQCFGMTSGAIAWAGRGKVPTRLFLAAAPGLLVGSTISSLVVRPSAILVKGVFGPVSVLVGVIILADRALPALFAVSVLGGLVTGWVAIGEGEIVAAFLILVYGLAPERGIGLGVALLSLNSIFLAVLHMRFLGGLPWELGAFTILGCVFGARLGPWVSQRVSQKFLKLAFAAIAITDGLIFTVQFALRHGH